MKHILFRNPAFVEKTDDIYTHDKLVEVGVHDTDSISDGFHTFGELYDHRITLFIALCKMVNAEDETQKQMRAFKEGFSFDVKGWNRRVWRSKLHSDGTSIDGWYILGIDKEAGKQITYHIPIHRWSESDFAETLEKAPEFDRHTQSDVLDRLKKLHL